MDNTEQKVRVGAIFADLHNGAFDALIWYNELKDGALKYLDSLAVLDYIIIAGDFFNNKISVNSEHARYAIQFLNKLIKICKRHGAKLRIIKGTESHDNNQLEALNVLLLTSEIDYRTIETLESEWLFDDMNVLYIPEEYVPDKKEYYKEKFSTTYDMVFGHGLIAEALMMAAKQESESTMARAPIFNTEELLSIAKGPIFFGHVHKRIIFKKRFYYINSYSRWAFGEEEDKGFYMCAYTPETSAYKAEYIVNKTARKFDTIEIELNPQKTNENHLEMLIGMANALTVDFLRLEIHIPEEYPNSELIVKLLNEAFGKRKNNKLKIINNGKLRKTKEMQEKINTLLTKYDFIFDKNLPPEDKLSQYIKEKYSVNMSVERIYHLLYEDIMKGA